MIEYDAKKAFQCGESDVEIYMKLPPGYHLGQKDDTMCRLRKSSHGLEQSSSLEP